MSSAVKMLSFTDYLSFSCLSLIRIGLTHIRPKRHVSINETRTYIYVLSVQ